MISGPNDAVTIEHPSIIFLQKGFIVLGGRKANTHVDVEVPHSEIYAKLGDNTNTRTATVSVESGALHLILPRDNKPAASPSEARSIEYKDFPTPTPQSLEGVVTECV